MLSEIQIERYCRQIVLPEIGSRGQERLLDSVVAISGQADPALVCATYLAGAGVGHLFLEIPDFPPLAGSAIATALGPLRDRNPDCRILASPPENPDVTIWIGSLPGRLVSSERVLVLWGAACGSTLTSVRFDRGRACLDCLHEAAPSDCGIPPTEGAEVLLGSILAQEALSALVGFGNRGSEILRADLARTSFTTLPFPRRPGCPVCNHA